MQGEWMSTAGRRARSSEAPEQARVLATLVGAQVLSGAGLAAGITVGALLAQQMLGTTRFAGLPAAVFTVGSAVAAVTVGRISQRFGRRPGLAAGYLTGAVGSAGVVLATALDNLPALFAAFFVYGAGAATNLQARYAGADLASPSRRARAVSTVLVATTLGAVIGPTLVGVMGEAALSWGIAALAGPFVLAAGAYGAAALVLWTLLRPDPLLLARARAGAAPPVLVPEASLRRHRWSAALGFGTLVMVVTQMVMIAVMTMTPVHMEGHGHAVAAVGTVIAVHVAAMYLPSPLAGWLVDRIGPTRVAGGAALVLLAAGVLAAIAPSGSVPALAAALAVLGLGWSLGLVSGTAIITEAVPLSTRASTQGTVDVLIALAGAAGGAVSGVVVAGSSYAALALGGGALALALLPVVRRAGRAPSSPPAPVPLDTLPPGV
jgi:MFS family permease